MRLPLLTQTSSTALVAQALPVPEANAMPHARQLAELGAVLCLYRVQSASELDGWSQAVHAASESVLDSDGLCESLQFFDRDGHCCWRLYLLPDTDFLAWESLVAGLPAQRDGGSTGGIGERLWRRMSRYLGGPAWRANILRFHALPSPIHPGEDVLAASLPVLSDCGAEVARRFVQREGTECMALIEACRCRCHAAHPETASDLRDVAGHPA